MSPSPLRGDAWRSGQAQLEARSLLAVAGVQVVFVELGKSGTVHAEVVLPLDANGAAVVRPWGIDAPYTLRLEELRHASVARDVTRAAFLAASAANRRLAAEGRFTCPA